MIIVEYADDRRALTRANVTSDVFAVPEAIPVESADNVPVSAQQSA
jgi:hypothetical protein